MPQNLLSPKLFYADLVPGIRCKIIVKKFTKERLHYPRKSLFCFSRLWIGPFYGGFVTILLQIVPWTKPTGKISDIYDFTGSKRNNFKIRIMKIESIYIFENLVFKEHLNACVVQVKNRLFLSLSLIEVSLFTLIDFSKAEKSG